MNMSISEYMLCANKAHEATTELREASLNKSDADARHERAIKELSLALQEVTLAAA